MSNLLLISADRHPGIYTGLSFRPDIDTMTFISPGLHASVLRNAALATLLSCSAATAYAAPSCDIGELLAIPLTYTDDMRPLMDASINGSVVSAMVNIGSDQTTILNKKKLDQLGIKVNHVTSTQYRNERDSRGNIVPTGDVIVREGLNALIKDYAAGRTKGRNLWFVVEDFMDDTFGARIGAGTLLQTDLELDLDGGYLKSFKPDGCFREHLAYWDPKAIAVPVRADVWKRDPRPVFNVLVNGKEVWALLSTGTPHSYLPASAAGRLGLAPTSPGATREDPLPGDAPDKPVWNVPVAQMSIGGMDIKDFNLRLMDLPYSGELMVLGADFLHRHRVYIALSQQKVYLSEIETPTQKRGSVKVIPQPME